MNIPDGMDMSQAQSATAAENLPSGVPRLAHRWKSGMDFGEFTDETLKNYY